jgi:hypothetical protein
MGPRSRRSVALIQPGMIPIHWVARPARPLHGAYLTRPPLGFVALGPTANRGRVEVLQLIIPSSAAGARRAASILLIVSAVRHHPTHQSGGTFHRAEQEVADLQSTVRTAFCAGGDGELSSAVVRPGRGARDSNAPSSAARRRSSERRRLTDGGTPALVRIISHASRSMRASWRRRTAIAVATLAAPIRSAAAPKLSQRRSSVQARARSN